MSSFFFALVATFLVSAGGRDQRLVAHLAATLGAGGPLLAAAWIASAITAVLAALAGDALAELLPPAAKAMLAAFALLLAALELAWPLKPHNPHEPTRSVFAVAIVIGARQLGDGARFLIAAIAAATGAPGWAALGGALGAGAALTFAWSMGPRFGTRFPLRATRLVVAGLLGFAAVMLGLSARGIL